jgi:hypothetical protein
MERVGFPAGAPYLPLEGYPTDADSDGGAAYGASEGEGPPAKGEKLPPVEQITRGCAASVPPGGG